MFVLTKIFCWSLYSGVSKAVAKSCHFNSTFSMIHDAMLVGKGWNDVVTKIATFDE